MFKSFTYLYFLRYGVIILCLFLAAVFLVESITVILQTIIESGFTEAQRLADFEVKKFSAFYLYEKKVEVLRLESSLELARQLGVESQNRIFKNLCSGVNAGLAIHVVVLLGSLRVGV